MNDTSPIRDASLSDGLAPQMPTAYFNDLPDDILQFAMACFPQFKWESQQAAQALHAAANPPQKRTLLSGKPPPVRTWHSTLSPLDSLVFWSESPQPPAIPATSASTLALSWGPFGRETADAELSCQAHCLVLRPIGRTTGSPVLVAQAGPPTFMLPEVPLFERFGVASIGSFETVLQARDAVPDQPITALVTRSLTLDEQIELSKLGIRIVDGVRIAGPLLARAAHVVTDVLEVALAARALGLPATALGDAAASLGMSSGASSGAGGRAEAKLDGQAIYGFAHRMTLAPISHAELQSGRLARIGPPDAELATIQPIDPRTTRRIVVGQPGRTIVPFARHFGHGAWQKETPITMEALEGAASHFGHTDLIVYARDRALDAWCRGPVGRAKRVYDRNAIDYPLSLTLTNIQLPALSCHRVQVVEDRLAYALAADVDALTLDQRDQYRREGERMRPLLKRLQTVRRLARFNKIEVGRRYGPLGTACVLVLGAEEDTPAALATNKAKLSDADVVKAVVAQRPDARVLYFPQKKAAADAKHMAAIKAIDRCVVAVDPPLGMSELAHVVSEVHTIDSMLGVFALAEGLPVVVYGQPPYAGLGPTRDVEIDSRSRPPQVADPLDLDTFLGWYFSTNVLFADTLSGEPLDLDAFVRDWTPYLGELSDEIADRLVEIANEPTTAVGDIQQLLRILAGHAKRAHVDRMMAAREPAALIAKGPALALEFALVCARNGDWRQTVTRTFQIWQKHAATAQPAIFAALLKARALLNSTSEIEDFDHFLLATFRTMPGKDVEALGNEFLNKRYFDTALTLYRSCPASKALATSFARCFIGQGDVARAEKAIAEVVRLKETPEAVQQLRSSLLERTGQLDGVIDQVKVLVAKEPTNYAQKLRLAHLLRDAGRLHEAVDVLMMLVRSSQGAAAMRSLAGIYISQMETSKARGLLEAQLGATPTDTVCWKLLGQVHAFENRLAEACNCLYVALSLSPLDIGAHTQLTEFEAEMAKGGDGVANWTRALDDLLTSVDQPSIETLLAHGRARLQVHDFETLKTCCLEAMRLYPDDARANAWYAHALAWEMTEKTPEVIAAIREHYGVALARDHDDNTWAILDGIRSLAKVGDIDGIRHLVRENEASLYSHDRERMVIPRYSAALALGDYLTAFDAMRDIHRQRVLKRNARSFRLARSIEEVGWREKLLILSEGGVGDELRYSTLYPELIERFPDARISVDERLLTLFERSFPMVKSFIPLPRYHGKRLNRDHLPSIGSLPDRDLAPFAHNGVWAAAGEADVVLPVPCTLADLRRSETDFQRGRAVRLVARDDLVARWREKLRPYSDRLIVGATWTSMLRQYQRIENYLTHEEMAPVFRMPGAVFVNCQYENVDSELAWARDALGVEIVDFPELDKRDDFEGLAALIANFDLFIGTATTTTEYAALLGCPTIYASPTNMNAYRNPARSEVDRFYSALRMINPIPSSNRRSMMERICVLLDEAIAAKRDRVSHSGKVAS